MSDHRPLRMRANRLLGASLVEHNLISLETLEAANERLLERMTEDGDEPVSLLSILTDEQKVLSEQQLLTFQSEELGLGVVDLANYEQPDDLRKKIDPAVCRATWTVPFDHEEGVTFVATAFYLSPAVRSYWEQEIRGPIVWYATTIGNLHDFLRKLEIERENIAAGARSS